MSSRLNIAHIIVRLEVGGAERSLLRLVEATEREINHHVFCLGVPTELGTALSAAGATVTYYDYRKPVSVWALRRDVRALAPSLIQGWMYYGNVIASLLFASQAPVVWNIRHALGGAPEKWSIRLALRLGKLVRRRLVIFNSRRARQSHVSLGYTEPMSRVIVNGIDTNHFKPDRVGRREVRARYHVPAEVRWLGLVGRYHPHKGVTVFLEALRRLLTDDPHWRGALIGRDMNSSNSDLQAQIARAGLDATQIDLIGEVSDPAQWLPALDGVVISSEVESFPNVAVEAMSCGVPVVGTDVGDLRDIVGDDTRVVPAGDSAALAKAIARHVWNSEPSLLDRQRVETRYQVRDCAEAYVSAYQQLVGGR